MVDVDASVWLQLGAQLESVETQLRKRNDARDYQLANIPQDAEALGAGVVPASGPLFIDLGHPDQGRYWQVRHVAVAGVPITATAAGVAYIYKRGAPPSDLGVTGWIDYTSLPLPQPAFYSTHQFVVNPSEHVWVVIVGGTVGQQYAAHAIVEDWAGTAFGAALVE